MLVFFPSYESLLDILCGVEEFQKTRACLPREACGTVGTDGAEREPFTRMLCGGGVVGVRLVIVVVGGGCQRWGPLALHTPEAIAGAPPTPVVVVTAN